MSKYTTEIRWLVESGWDFGLKSYPIFEESYRAGLNAKIIEHYYFREIGLETAALFNRFLNRKMNEIMPYYNQLYLSALLEITPLTRLDYTEAFDKTANTTDNTVGSLTTCLTANSTTNDNGLDQSIMSETPQNIVLNADISENPIPATSATVSKNTNEQTSTSNANNTNNSTNDTNVAHSEDYLKTVKGNNAGRTDSEMLMEYRKTFLNIDMKVIEELEELFMGVW